MTFEFRDEWNERIYNEWTDVLQPVFGSRLAKYRDIYEATHAHRIEHNKGNGDGPCTAWPSPPYRAPMWPIVVEIAAPRRFLEIGCGLAYTAALMADAGGADSLVDTIESDPQHAELAERWLDHEGLLDRVRVLKGNAEDVLPGLAGAYDVVFVDGGGPELEAHALRLVGRGGALVSKTTLRDEVEGIVASIRESESRGEEAVQAAGAEAEEKYRNAVTRALVRGGDRQ